jgi:hypothetical protein
MLAIDSCGGDGGKFTIYDIRFTSRNEIRAAAVLRSAELHSAVSRICNPQVSSKQAALVFSSTPPNAIRRYSRFQICATSAVGQRA